MRKAEICSVPNNMAISQIDKGSAVVYPCTTKAQQVYYYTVQACNVFQWAFIHNVIDKRGSYKQYSLTNYI